MILEVTCRFISVNLESEPDFGGFRTRFRQQTNQIIKVTLPAEALPETSEVLRTRYGEAGGVGVGSGRMSRCNVALPVTSPACEVMVIVIAEVTVSVAEKAM